MNVQELHRGRLIDHVQLVVKNLELSKKFYSNIFLALGVPMGGEGIDYFWTDELFVSTKESKAADGRITGRIHLAFQANTREAVDFFYKLGIEGGGKENGAPGIRPYHPHYYAAFLIDPDGNNIEAVYHGVAARSAASVKITFE